MSEEAQEGRRSPPANVAAAMFGWAREVAHLDVEEIARALGIKPAKWIAWERGEATPTMVQLRKLADTIRQPIGVFFLPEPPAIVDPALALRRLPGGAHPSRALVVEARRALARREIALDLLADEQDGALGPALSSLGLTLGDDVEEAAGRLREVLGVSLDEQRKSSWPIAVWRDAVERAGVLVFETRDIDIADARGFALPERPLPVIVLNGRDAPTARLFTLVHECVHLALGEGSVCDGADRQVERYCDRVAAATLLPPDALREDLDVRRHARGETWRGDELARIAKRFGVSEQALLIRLVSLGLARMAEYNARRAGFRARRKIEGEVRIPAHVMALKYAGRLYSRIVLGALARESITLTDVSRYLDLGASRVALLEKALVERPR